MTTDRDRVARELRSALDSLRGERDQLDNDISAMETLLAHMGVPAKRGPGRPKSSGVKRGPGRPRKTEAGSAKRKPGRPKSSGRPKGSGKEVEPSTQRSAPKWSAAAREAARQRMQTYWANRKKKGTR